MEAEWTWVEVDDAGDCCSWSRYDCCSWSRYDCCSWSRYAFSNVSALGYLVGTGTIESTFQNVCLGLLFVVPATV